MTPATAKKRNGGSAGWPILPAKTKNPLPTAAAPSCRLPLWKAAKLSTTAALSSPSGATWKPTQAARTVRTWYTARISGKRTANWSQWRTCSAPRIINRSSSPKSPTVPRRRTPRGSTAAAISTKTGRKCWTGALTKAAFSLGRRR